MMPVVRINDATFADLSTLKTWLGTKSPSETINLIVREAMEQLGIERDDEAKEAATTTSDGGIQFDTAPGLAFTKPLLHNPRQSAILLATIAQLKAKEFEGEKLTRELAIPAKVGQ